LHEAANPDEENVADETYAGLKALCERVAAQRFPGCLISDDAASPSNSLVTIKIRG
jgi:hypothetical protein